MNRIVEASSLEALAVFRRHPSLLLRTARGRVDVMKSHARIEVERAQKVLEDNRNLGLDEIVRIHEAVACYNYKSTYLYSIARLAKPEVVIETGVAAGISSFSILQALEDNKAGVLYSIDLPNATEKVPRRQEPGFLVPERLRPRWKLLLGDSRELLPSLVDRLGTIDVFCHDSLHTAEHMRFEYETAWPHIRSGGLLYSDDLDPSDVFADFCRRLNLTATVLSRREVGKSVRFGWVQKP